LQKKLAHFGEERTRPESVGRSKPQNPPAPEHASILLLHPYPAALEARMMLDLFSDEPLLGVDVVGETPSNTILKTYKKKRKKTMTTKKKKRGRKRTKMKTKMKTKTKSPEVSGWPQQRRLAFDDPYASEGETTVTDDEEEDSNDATPIGRTANMTKQQQRKRGRVGKLGRKKTKIGGRREGKATTTGTATAKMRKPMTILRKREKGRTKATAVGVAAGKAARAARAARAEGRGRRARMTTCRTTLRGKKRAGGRTSVIPKKNTGQLLKKVSMKLSWCVFLPLTHSLTLMHAGSA